MRPRYTAACFEQQSSDLKTTPTTPQSLELRTHLERLGPTCWWIVSSLDGGAFEAPPGASPNDAAVAAAYTALSSEAAQEWLRMQQFPREPSISPQTVLNALNQLAHSLNDKSDQACVGFVLLLLRLVRWLRPLTGEPFCCVCGSARSWRSSRAAR